MSQVGSEVIATGLPQIFIGYVIVEEVVIQVIVQDFIVCGWIGSGDDMGCRGMV